MPELVYIRSYILSAISLANRLNDMDKVVSRLEDALEAVGERQRGVMTACYQERFGANVVNLSTYRLTDFRRNRK